MLLSNHGFSLFTNCICLNISVHFKLRIIYMYTHFYNSKDKVGSKTNGYTWKHDNDKSAHDDEVQYCL